MNDAKAWFQDLLDRTPPEPRKYSQAAQPTLAELAARIEALGESWQAAADRETAALAEAQALKQQMQAIDPDAESRQNAAVAEAVRNSVRKYHAGFSAPAPVKMAQSAGTTEGDEAIAAVAKAAVARARSGHLSV